MTTPTRDRVREARDKVFLLMRRIPANIPTHEEAHVYLDAYRDALLDAVDEDVAGVAIQECELEDRHFNAGIDKARAAIRARKETT